MDASDKIDQLIAGITDWRGKTFAALRKAILEADKDIIEEWKWRGTPVWSRGGIIAVANAHKDKVKMTFMNGAQLADPDTFFNTGFDGNKWRAIDLFEGDTFDATALKKLVHAAIAYNEAKTTKKAAPAKKVKASVGKAPVRKASGKTAASKRSSSKKPSSKKTLAKRK